MKRKGSIVLAAVFALVVAEMKPTGVFAEPCRAKGKPEAQQIGALEQLLSVAMVPVEILGAMTFAQGESYVEGRAYKGDYARHGFYRTHARWWDPHLYYHE